MNANGKIDRKLLSSPDFSHLSSIHLTNNMKLLEPRDETETIIHHIWCDIFQQTQISVDTNIFQYWWSFITYHATLSSIQE